MKIKVGEYVRTKYGEIFKVIEIPKQKEYILVDEEVNRSTDRDCNDNYLEKDEIIKHSNNIIDILEPGDYINGIKVDYVFPPLKIFADAEEYLEDEIETIVTKEQFKGTEYKV